MPNQRWAKACRECQQDFKIYGSSVKLPTKERKALLMSNTDYKSSKAAAKAKRGAEKAVLTNHGANNIDHLDGILSPEDLTHDIKEIRFTRRPACHNSR